VLSNVLSNGASLRPFAPELVLGIGVLVVLLVGLVGKGGSRGLLLGLTVAILAGAAVATAVTRDEATRALFGGLLARDGFGDYFKFLFVAAAALVALASVSTDEIGAGPSDDRAVAEYAALLLAAALGAALMASATDLLTAYLSLEFISILSYVLAAFSPQRPRSAEAGLKYAIYGGVATGAMLYGFSLLYGLAASTELNAVRVALTAAPPLVAGTALALCLAGFGFKLAIVPFHMWCPDVYQGAPTPVAAFFSVVPKAAGFALAYRFLLGGAAPLVPALGPATGWAAVLAALAAATMTLGNLAALGQRNLKRLLAYSSIAHAGTMTMALALGTESGARALMLYAGIYLFMNLAAFLAVVAFIHRGVGETVDDLAGLGRRAPLPALCLTLALFSLAGLPPFGGFVAKFAIISATIERGATGGGLYFGLAALAVLNTVVALYYYARVAKVMYFDLPREGAGPVRLAPIHVGLLGATTLAVIALGIYVPPLSSLVAASAGGWAGR